MDPPAKEHIKYQFCNVFSDLLSDLKSFSNVRCESVTSNSGDEITYAPNPEVKNSTSVSVYKTRGRSRKSEPDDIFSELKASRSKKKPSSFRSEITANFETKQDHKIQVTADVHRDASQPSEESAKIEAPTSDEVFDSLRDKRPSEFEITCSQESDDFLPVSKKSRKSYPGASVAKVNALHSAKRLSFDTEPEFEILAKKLGKKLSSSTSKSFLPNETPGSTEYNSELDKFRSSPGWSRVKAVAKDFKDSSRKLLDISSSKPRSSKTSTAVSVTPKAGNSSILNTSTSDSDQSDVRYFDSPNAEKRYQLMKHVVDITERNEVGSPGDFIVVPDPVVTENLKKATEEFVKKLCESVNTRTLKRKREESPNSKDQRDKREVPLKSAIQGVKESESPLKAEKPSTSALDRHMEKSLKSPNKLEEPYDFVQIRTPNKQLKSPLKAQKSIQNENQNELLNSPLNVEKSPDSAVNRSLNKQLKSPLKAQRLIQNRNQNEQLNSPLKREKSSDSIQTRNLNKQFNSPLNAEKSPGSDKDKNRYKQLESPFKAKSSDSIQTRNLNKELKSPLKANRLASPDHVQTRNQNKQSELPLKAQNSPVSDQKRNRNKQQESPVKASSLSLFDSVQTEKKTEQLESFIEALELSPTESVQRGNRIEQFEPPPKAEKSLDFVRARNRNEIARSPDPENNSASLLKSEKSSDSIRVRNRNKTGVPTPEKNLKSSLKTEKSCDFVRTRNQNKAAESPDISMSEKNLEPLPKAEKSLDFVRARNRSKIASSPDPKKNLEFSLKEDKSSDSICARKRNKIGGLPGVPTPEKNLKSPLKTGKSCESVRTRNQNKVAESTDVSIPEKNLESLLKAEKSSDFVCVGNRNKVAGPPDVLIPKKKQVDKASDPVRAKNRNQIAGPQVVHVPEKNQEPLPKTEKSFYPFRNRNLKKIDLVSEKNPANTDESVVCLGEFDFDHSQSLEGVTQNEKSSTCGKPVGMSSEKDGMLELSNCDVSEAPLSSNHSSGVGSVTRRKLNVRSKDLENALTQVISSSGESSVFDKLAYEATIPFNPSQNLCSRCSCALSDFNSSQNDGGSNRTEFASAEEKENKRQNNSKPKLPLVDASVQTDDVLVTEIRSSKETYVQTSPSSQVLETIPCKDKTDEKIIRMKDEYILQTLKSLMVQASHKLTINDLYNLGFEQENEPPRKKLKEITANNSHNLVKFEDDLVRNENLPLQTWSLSANRGIANDNAVHPPSDLKTPQNQGILRKTTSDMKYSLVSTPSSSERKLLDDAKFLNRSTVCLKDVTICDEEIHPAEDSISKDVVPMEVEDFPNANEVLQSKTKVSAPNPNEIETSKLDIVRIRDKTNSSSSNDSLIFSSRKSAHRSLNFQHFFTKVNDSPSKAENVNSQLHFSNEDVGSKHTNDSSKKVTFSFNSGSGGSNLPHNQIDELEYSEDIRKSLSVFPECMDTQKPDGDTEGGIVDNSDEDSIIQATPKKIPLTESSLTPDMLSSQNSQAIKEEDTDFHPVPEPTITNSCKFIISDADNRPCQTDFSVSKQSNSNIDSQVNEIPSSLIEDIPKQPERRNNLHNIPRLNHSAYQEVRSSPKPTIPDPVSSVTTKGRDVTRGSGYIIRSPVTQKQSESNRLFITTSGLPNRSKLKVHEFCKQFNYVCESDITDRTTHLVIRADKNKSITTLKYVVAVATHKIIVTVDWVVACLAAKNILPEDPYIPLSSTGQPGPLNSVLNRSNPSSLFKDFIIHIVPPFGHFTGKDFNDILTWCGAKIAETYSDFTSDNSRVRLVLINTEGAEEKSSFYREVVLRYKAFILSHDWAIESVSNYRIEPFCTYNPLSAVYSFEMVSQFQIPNYIRDLASRYFESEDSDDTMSEMSNLP